LAFVPSGTLPARIIGYKAYDSDLDWRVLLFAIGASLLSGLLFGLVPMLRIPVRSVEQALRAGARTIAGRSRRLHSGFVISEIALAVVLLVSARMLRHALLALSSLDPGLNVHNLMAAHFALSPGSLESPEQIRAAWQDVVDRHGASQVSNRWRWPTSSLCAKEKTLSITGRRLRHRRRTSRRSRWLSCGAYLESPRRGNAAP